MKRILVVLAVSLAACGPNSNPASACDEPCLSVTATAVNCDQTPMPPACSPAEPTDDPPPPPPPPAASPAPTSGVYEGYATIVGLPGPVSSGCWALNNRLFVRLTLSPSGPDDGTGNVTMISSTVDDYRFNSLATQLGGASSAEQEERTYALHFSADLSGLSGRVTYTRNAAATYRTDCSGYVFNFALGKL